MKNLGLTAGKDGRENAIAIHTPNGRIVVSVREPYNEEIETNLYVVAPNGVSRVLSLADILRLAQVQS